MGAECILSLLQGTVGWVCAEEAERHLLRARAFSPGAKFVPSLAGHPTKSPPRRSGVCWCWGTFPQPEGHLSRMSCFRCLTSNPQLPLCSSDNSRLRFSSAPSIWKTKEPPKYSSSAPLSNSTRQSRVWAHFTEEDAKRH